MTMNVPTPVSESSMKLPVLDVIYEDDITGEMMALRVRTTLKDRSAYEIYAHKNNLPTKEVFATATFTWFAFQAWSALRREPNAPAKLRTGDPDSFLDAILDINPVDESEDVTVVDPTQSEASNDSD